MTTTTLTDKIQSLFTEKHGSTPLLIQSPGRINLIGEHTDYNDGFVLPAAIDRYIICALARNGHKDHCSVHAADFGETCEFSLAEVSPQERGSWKNYVLGVVAEMQQLGRELSGFDIVFGGNIPNGAGLSSSAALENSIAFGLDQLFDLGIPRKEMTLISQRAEHHFAGVKCGIMDQFASMLGQKDHALFLDCRSLDYTPVPVDFNDYELLLINTNVKHSLADSAYNDRRNSCEAGVRILRARFPHIKALRDATENDLGEVKHQLDEEVYARCLYIIRENRRVQQAVAAMKEDDIPRLGSLLFASHEGLQHQYEVSCPELDYLVEKAKKNPDITGSRMMGGGFGGCTINLIKKGRADSFVQGIKQEYSNTFNKELSTYSVSLTNGTSLAEPPE
ncbi:galactokinase [Sinomicrobium weinanense]|uniref:Galactokinase n=1 Tax=Sinomicrobium weinanense TaxID=2842200 RepID=A0A926Q5N4_9FLAO|nr:galactokinase [Sinomicrobium weinanense]MBC9798175.1 galactokinase [Sinomicrobium weinanense]MBU3122139.1 galactokinase [Sinomicrobium weinanense]